MRQQEPVGSRATIRDAGGTLVAMGLATTLLTIMRTGWYADIEAAHCVFAVGVLVAFLGWTVMRASLAAGRTAPAITALVTVSALGLAGISGAAGLGAAQTVARNVPAALLGVGLLLPGILVLVISSRMATVEVRESWTKEEWLRRFRGGLRARLVPSATVRAHCAEIEQALSCSAGRAEGAPYALLGHPAVAARDLAATDKTSTARRWWLWSVSGAVLPLVTVGLILTTGSWGVLTFPLAGLLLLAAPMRWMSTWGDRPWR